MNLYTPTDVSQLATRADLLGAKTELRDELGALRVDVERQIADVRVSVEHVHTVLHQAIAGQTRWIIGFVMSWSAVVVAAVKLLF